MSDQEPDDEIRQAAAAALADVEALGVDGEDRKIILAALLEARLGGSNLPPPRSGQEGPPARRRDPRPDEGQNGDLIDRIGSILGVDRDALDLVYAVQNGEPELVISAKRISPNKSLATRQLGQLIAAARQTTGIEEWTSVGTIRRVVSDYGRLDSANFASSVQQMDAVAVLRGKGQQRELKVTRPGLEATADLIRGLAGSDS